VNIIAMLKEAFVAIAKWCSCAETKTEFRAENEVLKDKKRFQKQIQNLQELQVEQKKKFQALIVRCLELIKPFSKQFDRQQQRAYKKLLVDIRKAVLQ